MRVKNYFVVADFWIDEINVVLARSTAMWNGAPDNRWYVYTYCPGGMANIDYRDNPFVPRRWQNVPYSIVDRIIALAKASK